jgi:hypothetical protein
MKVILTLTDEMLGTKASDLEIFDTWIASKAQDDEHRKTELENAEEAAEREKSGTTVFHRNKKTGKIGIYAYQIKGFLKEAAEAANRFDKELRNNLEKLAAYKKKIDQCVFVQPDWIDIQMPKGEETGSCQRPLRAQTAQGERVTLVNSESVPVGSTLEFEIKVMSKELLPYIEFYLNYGCLRGLGQWRNSGKGRFTFVEKVETADPKKKPAELLKEISDRAASHKAK